MDKVIAIVGPTASGKTALSIELAKQLDGEIINGDSMQVYRRLSIGTAKITEVEMEGIPHHLLDILEPDAAFSVADYQKLVREKITEIASRGKQPIIVGGTGLYVQAVLFDFRFPEQKADSALRNRLAEQLEVHGPAHMHAQLMVLNPAADIHPNNTRRVLRALEILMSGGEQPSGEQALVPLYDETIIGLDMPREELYERINLRVDRMMEQGLLGEVEALYRSGLRGVQSVQAIGYKELYAFLEGEIGLAEALLQLKQNSRRYAKRQLTYFRNKLPVHWLDGRSDAVGNVQNIIDLLQENGGMRRKP